MAEKLADVLKAAKLLAANGEYNNRDIKVKLYPGNKVRVFGLTSGSLPDVLLVGDAMPSDTDDAKKATNYFTQAMIDAKLTAVVQLAESVASAEVKPTAPAAVPSS